MLLSPAKLYRCAEDHGRKDWRLKLCRSLTTDTHGTQDCVGVFLYRLYPRTIAGMFFLVSSFFYCNYTFSPMHNSIHIHKCWPSSRFQIDIIAGFFFFGNHRCWFWNQLYIPPSIIITTPPQHRQQPHVSYHHLIFFYKLLVLHDNKCISCILNNFIHFD